MGVGAADRDAEEPAGQHVARWRRSRRGRPPGWPPSAPSMPWARRSPNSSTGSPRAASTTRAALVATSVWKLMRFSSARLQQLRLEQRAASPAASGSCGKTSVPSGTASTSQVSAQPAEEIEKRRLEQRPAVVARAGPPGRPGLPRSKRRISRYSTAVARPAATVKPPPKGCSRKKRWKTAWAVLACPSSSSRRPWSARRDRSAAPGQACRRRQADSYPPLVFYPLVHRI